MPKYLLGVDYNEPGSRRDKDLRFESWQKASTYLSDNGILVGPAMTTRRVISTLSFGVPDEVFHLHGATVVLGPAVILSPDIKYKPWEDIILKVIGEGNTLEAAVQELLRAVPELKVKNQV